jgi:hypothetical protein
MKTALTATLAFAAAMCPARAALVVSTAPTSNVTCSAGVCSAAAADAVLNVKDLKRLLAAGDVTVASGSVAGDIVFAAKLQWTKPGRLTLDAYRGIAIGLDITSEGTGGVTLTTDDGGSGGELVFTGKGKVSFWGTSNSLIIDGTPYTLVGSIAGLASSAAANPNGAFALSKYYDASADGVYTSTPVPGDFGGTFEGLGHVIDNFALAPPDGASFIGLFANVTQSGVVRDLTLTNASLRSKAAFYGAILASANRGTISHVGVTGAIVAAGAQGSGLLAGYNTGTISWCTAAGSIRASGGQSSAGGLVTENGGTIAHSLSTVAVQAHYAGGLVSLNELGLIETSAATGAVDGGGRGADPAIGGGLVALNQGTIDQSFSTGAIDGEFGGRRVRHRGEGRADAGGLVGANEGTITNAYSTGSVAASGTTVSGGFAADSGGTIGASYSTGANMLDGKPSFGFIHAGTSDMNDYWDTDTSGTPVGCKDGCTGITGLTTAQLQSGLPAGFDPAVWAQSPSTNNGLPYLIANPPQ